MDPETKDKITTAPQEAELIIQKLPCDMGIHRNPRKGTLNAPEKILENHDFIKTVLIDEVFPDEFDLEETHERMFASTKDLIQYNKPIISIGGDHSVSYPVIKALKRKNPGLKLVWLDSHLDLKEKVGNNISHDVLVRGLLENNFEEEELYFVGVTRIDSDEKEYLEDKNLNIYRADEINQFFNDFNSEDSVYLSVDIDVLTNQLAPGTGYPDGELDLETVKKIIKTVQPDFADLVEIAPSLDENEKTLNNGRKILTSLEKYVVD